MLATPGSFSFVPFPQTNDVLPPTPPPAVEDEPNTAQALDIAGYVLSVGADALALVAKQYRDDSGTKDSFQKAVTSICAAVEAGRKLVVSGIGKSGIVAKKLVATMKSLGVVTSYMHAAEALHGDLGDLRPGDVLLFISFSGQTPEIVSLIPHIDDKTTIIGITSSPHCPFLEGLQRDSIYLPATIPRSEREAFGVRAPTISTLVAMAVADALALACAQRLHGHDMERVFTKNHPGGATLGIPN